MKRNETTNRGRRLGATTLALVAAGLTAAAFAAYSVAQGGDGGGSKDRVAPAPFGAPMPPGGPGAVAPSAEDREAFEAFRECMEENGAPAPPRPSGDGPPEPPSEQEMEQIRKALEACEAELPEGAHALPGPPPCDDEKGDRKEGEQRS